MIAMIWSWHVIQAMRNTNENENENENENRTYECKPRVRRGNSSNASIDYRDKAVGRVGDEGSQGKG
jgi:hypothetical protein